MNDLWKLHYSSKHQNMLLPGWKDCGLQELLSWCACVSMFKISQDFFSASIFSHLFQLFSHFLGYSLHMFQFCTLWLWLEKGLPKIYLSIFSFSSTATPASIRIGGGVESKLDLLARHEEMSSLWSVIDILCWYSQCVPPEVRRGLEHVNCGDLQCHSLQFGQKVQVHKILLQN